MAWLQAADAELNELHEERSRLHAELARCRFRRTQLQRAEEAGIQRALLLLPPLPGDAAAAAAAAASEGEAAGSEGGAEGRSEAGGSAKKCVGTEEGSSGAAGVDGAQARVRAAAAALEAQDAALEGAAAECVVRVIRAKEEREGLEKCYHALGAVAQSCRQARQGLSAPGSTPELQAAKVADVLAAGANMATEEAFSALQQRIRKRCQSLRLRLGATTALAIFQALRLEALHCDDPGPAVSRRLMRPLLRARFDRALGEWESACIAQSIKEQEQRLKAAADEKEAAAAEAAEKKKAAAAATAAAEAFLRAESRGGSEKSKGKEAKETKELLRKQRDEREASFNPS